LIGSFSGIGYRTFLAHELPIAAVGLVLVFAVIRFRYRRVLGADLELPTIEGRVAVHYPLMVKTLLVVAAMLILFLAGVPLALVAIAGAAYPLLTRRVRPEKVYREIDWELLVLFSGLFVVISGVEASGLAAELLGMAAAAHLDRPAVLTIVTAMLSNLVSNVP